MLDQYCIDLESEPAAKRRRTDNTFGWGREVQHDNYTTYIARDCFAPRSGSYSFKFSLKCNGFSADVGCVGSGFRKHLFASRTTNAAASIDKRIGQSGDYEVIFDTHLS